MPHSLSPEDATNSDSNPSVPVDTDKEETQTTETTLTQETAAENGDTQESESADHDMTMADVAEADTVPEVHVKPEIAAEVKLEDLFADMDSDEEFLSSTGQNLKITSSPPEAPPSPVYVLLTIL